MNLLVTNTFSPQAYDVIRALRPHAERVVATVEGDTRFQAGLQPGAYSRLVDKAEGSKRSTVAAVYDRRLSGIENIRRS